MIATRAAPARRRRLSVDVFALLRGAAMGAAAPSCLLLFARRVLNGTRLACVEDSRASRNILFTCDCERFRRGGRTAS